MQKFFYLSKNRETLGPFSIERVKQMLEKGQVLATDYIYLEDLKDWVSLIEFLPDYTQAKLSKAKVEEVKIHDQDWFVLKDQTRYGPYSYLEMIQMLQDQNVKEYDYVWCPAMTDWKKLAEVEDFSDRKLKVLELKTIGPKARRRYPRISLGASIIIHNNNRVWKGSSIEISEGGCQVVVEKNVFTLGDKITILFKPNHLLPPFHAKCEVVSQTTKGSQIVYNIKFLTVEKNIAKTIKKVAKKAA